ncbi:MULTISPECIES: DUF3958 family protein [Bacillus cereus group]|uniref:DUF3958 domain-containing protein n=5 Tax=Bacillus cereus group TaxID=86661 RepID=A0A9W5QTN6_BACCE|nr:MULTISPECIES: DUF3958 family protein [Bacillus cereus group]EEM41243.1 hypothetical protein bthur0004_27930 [Bacillus thuringiensis serovar sotto str. T04001]AFQ14336.1 hypothetical protein BTG_04195 [Bacillus thuringiensis HD-771]AZV66884.1 DUF3958 domain-containing protein [Bacillus cereus]EJP91405.1 hypothetical protein IC1_01960 [Bacillus cereus VD022]EOO09139.1 hypothetical protein IAW_01933 [Bacillus cereus str. Schrouff]
MSQEIETKISQCNQKLRIIFEEQNENRIELQNQERAEASFHEWKNRNNRLFNRILETWYGDKEAFHFFTNMRQEIGQYERKLTFELENEKETLLKEKRHLSEKENNLSYEQQQLQREANT